MASLRTNVISQVGLGKSIYVSQDVHTVLLVKQQYRDVIDSNPAVPPPIAVKAINCSLLLFLMSSNEGTHLQHLKVPY